MVTLEKEADIFLVMVAKQNFFFASTIQLKPTEITALNTSAILVGRLAVSGQ